MFRVVFGDGRCDPIVTSDDFAETQVPAQGAVQVVHGAQTPGDGGRGEHERPVPVPYRARVPVASHRRGRDTEQELFGGEHPHVQRLLHATVIVTVDVVIVVVAIVIVLAVARRQPIAIIVRRRRSTPRAWYGRRGRRQEGRSDTGAFPVPVFRLAIVFLAILSALFD